MQKVTATEPLIRNFRKIYKPGAEGGTRLIGLDDKPPTCTMSYSVIEPGKTSSHHIHPWEHEVYILEGSGVLVCDGKEYPVKEGDGMFIPGNVDHYTINKGTSGNIRRIEVNPLIASQNRGAAKPGGSKGSGKPPFIRNFRNLDMKKGHVLLSSKDGVPNYVLLYNGAMAPGAVSHKETGGHIHPWEHVVYVLQGQGTLVSGGKSYKVTEGDAVLVPPNTQHQWKNETKAPMLRVTFNPVASETAEH
ncbi:MAG TPA: cupin domain-containing protein [Dehalococcoidia bacterium]|nr:cupin domain-containing protein [Dehalococcoidia bacterium]